MKLPDTEKLGWLVFATGVCLFLYALLSVTDAQAAAQQSERTFTVNMSAYCPPSHIDGINYAAGGGGVKCMNTSGAQVNGVADTNDAVKVTVEMICPEVGKTLASSLGYRLDQSTQGVAGSCSWSEGGYDFAKVTAITRTIGTGALQYKQSATSFLIANIVLFFAGLAGGWAISARPNNGLID
jgi:hypothetical protein